MKKFFLFYALALASFANANNFYVGGSVGVSALDARKNHQILEATGATLRSEDHYLGRFGFIGGGFIGYNFDFCQSFDCGAEFFGNGFTTQAKAAHLFSAGVTSPDSLSVSQNYNWGFRILPGYQFCNGVEIHAIIGYTRGGFKLKDNGVYGIVNSSFNSNGYQVGGGTLFGLSRCLGLRLDIAYSGYPSSLKASGPAPTAAEGGPGGGVSTNYQVKVSSVDSTVSLIFDF